MKTIIYQTEKDVALLRDGFLYQKTQ